MSKGFFILDVVFLAHSIYFNRMKDGAKGRRGKFSPPLPSDSVDEAEVQLEYPRGFDVGPDSIGAAVYRA